MMNPPLASIAPNLTESISGSVTDFRNSAGDMINPGWTVELNKGKITDTGSFIWHDHGHGCSTTVSSMATRYGWLTKTSLQCPVLRQVPSTVISRMDTFWAPSLLVRSRATVQEVRDLLMRS